MTICERLAQYSGGKWVSADAARDALGMKKTLGSYVSQLMMLSDYVVQVSGMKQRPKAYRAVKVAGLDYFQIARVRKSMGFSTAPEMFKLVGEREL